MPGLRVERPLRDRLRLERAAGLDGQPGPAFELGAGVGEEVGPALGVGRALAASSRRDRSVREAEDGRRAFASEESPGGRVEGAEGPTEYSRAGPPQGMTGPVLVDGPDLCYERGGDRRAATPNPSGPKPDDEILAHARLEGRTGTPLSAWSDQFAGQGLEAVVTRESPSVSWIEVSALGLRGYAVMEGLALEAINFELLDPDPSPARDALTRAAAALRWELDEDDDDDDDSVESSNTENERMSLRPRTGRLLALALALIVSPPPGAAEPHVEAAHDQRQERLRGGGRLRRRQRRQARRRLGRHLVQGPRLDPVPRPRRPDGRGRTTTASPPSRWTSTATATPTSSPAAISPGTSAGSRTPAKAGKDWTYHEIDLPGTSEAAVLVDLTGDGKPEVLPNSTNVVVWYELEKGRPSPSGRSTTSASRRPVTASARATSTATAGSTCSPPKGGSRPRRPGPRHLDLAPRLGTRRRPASRSSPATSTATASPTSSGAWATTTASTGSGRSKAADGEADLVAKAGDRRLDRLGPHPALGRPRRRRQGRRARHRQARLRPRDRARRDRRLGDRLLPVRPRVEGLVQARHLPGRARPERPRRRGPTATP